MVPEDVLDRFRRDLDALVPRGERIGVAVSGGPDSLGLLLLAAAARPGEVEAATVDHGFRPESRGEAEAVARACEKLDIDHEIRAIDWGITPRSAIQEQARTARYAALATWMHERGLRVLLSGHHLDDQAETLVMRLNRGSGVKGLAAMRPISPLPGAPDLKLVRPLLAWRRSELEEVCALADATPITDPSNSDPKHERVRIRQALANADWLDPMSLAKSAANLAAAHEALDWTADQVWRANVEIEASSASYKAGDAPAEVHRRILSRLIDRLATEGRSGSLRGSELDGLIGNLEAGETRTLRGVKCEGGPTWRFSSAPPRRTP